MNTRFKIKRVFSIILSALIIVSLFASVPVYAQSSTLSYSFSGDEAARAGFAEGIISLTASSGTYELYWADDIKALDGFDKLCSMSFSSSGTKTHSMVKRSAIPAGATQLIAVKSTSDKTVEKADAVYNIPQYKLFNHKAYERSYRFASYSDVHIDGTYATYQYADEHWRYALDTAAARNVDFVVLSGDYVNNNIDYSGISAYEWRTYQRIAAESDYCNPIYEAIGNHELWQSVSGGTSDFKTATGLEGSDGSSSSKAYFEKTVNGDHFIFMAMEGGFYPDRTEEFSEEQLNWLENLLQKYTGDGNNIYIIEHSLFYKYGAGDRIDPKPYYDIPLNDETQSGARFKSLLEEYKDAIFISGHTHIAFKEQYNFSDNNGTSAQMIHNSSIGGTRPIVNGSLDRTYPLDQTEGYIVDVYDDAIVFNGANLYYNLYDPNCCYIVKTSAEISGVPSAISDIKAAALQSETESFVKGDVNADGKVNIRDVTYIQLLLANKLRTINSAKKAADIDLNGSMSINDATYIQLYLVKKYKSFSEIASPASGEAVSKAQSDLSLYYRYSSYDAYQSLKKACRDGLSETKFTELNGNLFSIVDEKRVDSEEKITVFFEKPDNWQNVYAYCWGRKGSGNEGDWPGTAMTYVGKNEYQKSVYKYTVKNLKHNFISFTDNASKTQDILITADYTAYYISGSSSPFSVNSYKFKDSYIKTYG